MVKKEIYKNIIVMIVEDILFLSKRRKSSKQLEEEIFKLYVWKKQNLEDLSELFNSNTKTIQEKLENYQVEIKG